MQYVKGDSDVKARDCGAQVKHGTRVVTTPLRRSSDILAVSYDIHGMEMAHSYAPRPIGQ